MAFKLRLDQSGRDSDTGAMDENPYKSPSEHRETSSENSLPRPDRSVLTGNLILTRRRQYADSLRQYRIIVDDQEVGSLSVGEELRVELPEGQHRMVARIDWARSNYLTFSVRAGEATYVEVGANARGLLLIAAFYFATIGFWHYLYLRQRDRSH